MNYKSLRRSLLFVLGAFGVAGCSCASQTGASSEASTSFSESLSEKNQTYHFFIDYSHSEEDFYTLKWWTLTPIGTCPAECELSSKDATDPLFPVFLGWSLYPSAIDDSKLWNFATDSRAAIKVSLYGVWVAND